MAKKKKKNDSGQVIVEFLMVSFIAVSMIYLCIELAFVFSYGSFVQYAAFMGSRSYYASNITEQAQVAAGKKTLSSLLKNGESYLGFFYVQVEEPSSDCHKNNESCIGKQSRYVDTPQSADAGKGRFNNGVKLKIKSPFNFIDRAITVLAGKAGNWINYEAISFLGKESSEQECFEQLRNMKLPTIDEYKPNPDGVYYDNGC